MKINLKNIHSSFDERQKQTIRDFIKFLQSELPLSEDFEIDFVSEKTDNMTTGVRLAKHRIKVLSAGRMLIDTLRTLAHEWVHEFQHQKMGLKDTDKIQNIGGPEENMANSLSGIFIKKFAKQFPENEKSLYE